MIKSPDRFCKIIKLCVSTCKIPDSWKIATVTPLPKGGDPTNVSNFRPISVLPVPGKILERLLHSSISEHLEINSILTKKQGGYQKGKSTLDTISILVDDILSNRNKGNITLAAFIDIKKAFDSVNYVILLKKLENYGIRNRTLTLVENYLSKRQQCTLANNVKSECVALKCGVPQGSILGPLFFLLYINDCISTLDVHKTLLYADDSVLYVSGKNLDLLTNQLSVALHSFYNWSSINKLSMNEDKTKIMTFASKIKLGNLPNPKIALNGKELKRVVSYKYLGVILDEELNFSLHIKNLIKNMRFKSILLYRAREVMNVPSLLKIYKSHALPVIDYCDILYGGGKVELLDELQRVQNKCLKTCYGDHILTPTELVHAKAKLPMLSQRRLYHTRLYGFKRSRKDMYKQEKVRFTRMSSAPLLKYSHIHCASYEKSVEVSCGREWNALNVKTRKIETFEEFKNEMKILLEQSIPVLEN